MKAEGLPEVEDLGKAELMKLVEIYLGETLLHYGLWFSETVHRLGLERAVELEDEVTKDYFPSIMNRLAPHFGIQPNEGVQGLLATKSEHELIEFLHDISKTWVSGDGLWFQKIESPLGMEKAKEVNDTCWTRFGFLEASKIRKHMDIGTDGSLKKLERALRLRLYASTNPHTSEWDEAGGLIWTMTDCRVHSARRRKGMADYPCKSAGIAEYTSFALGIDSRIQTHCVYCPPDPVSDTEYCQWRFSL